MSKAQNGSLQDVGDDLSALKADLGKLVKQMVQENVLDRAGGIVKGAEKQVQERPFLSVLVAFIVGLLFGQILRGMLKS